MILDAGAAADLQPPTAGGVRFHDAVGAVDDAPGGEVRPRDETHEVDRVGRRVIYQVQQGVAHLPHVVRRDVGGHAHRDARRAVDQQVGHHGRQDLRLLEGTVEVVHPADRILVDVPQYVLGRFLEAALGVPHGRGGVAVHAAEVAVTVHHRVAEGEALGHPHQRIVDGGITVRMVLAQNLTHNPGALLVGLVGCHPQVVHTVQYAAVDGLEAVADIRQSPAHDDAHGVIDVGLLHLLLDRPYYLARGALLFPAVIWFDIIGHVKSPQMSRFSTSLACVVMNIRLGSTWSPISIVNSSSARMASSMVTFLTNRVPGSMVVSHS